MAVEGDPSGFYQLLGVRRGASPEEIRAAFRDLAKRYHPDTSGVATDDERFVRLREAYEVLRDPLRRLEYDAAAREGSDSARRRPEGERRRRPSPDPAAEARTAGPASPAGATAPRWPLGVAVVMLLALVVVTGLLLGGREEAASLRARLDELWAELDAARDAEADARSRLQAVIDAGPDVDPASAGGEGGGRGLVYRAELVFPPQAGEVDPAMATRLEAHVAELRAAVAAAPGVRDGWLLLVEGRNGRAAATDGVLVDEWGLTLLRLGGVADFLVRAGIPAERLAVRFQAGFDARAAAPAAAPPADESPDAAAEAEAEAARRVTLKVLCCPR